MSCKKTRRVLQDYPDIKFPELNSTVDGYVMRYNHAIEAFDLVSADNILIKSTDTSTPDEFIEVLEGELDASNIGEIDELDGGSFIDYSSTNI